MKRKWLLLASLAVAAFLAGCATPIPPGAERGPHNTMAYDVLVEASEPGARIEANGEVVGNTPVHLKIFGDPDGTFHDFGSYYYVIRALPLTTNQFVQTRVFYTGRLFTPEDRIPQRISFDMSQHTPAYSPVGPPAYVYPAYGPPVYYGPSFYYGWPYYYGPSFRYYYGPHHHHGPHYHRNQ